MLRRTMCALAVLALSSICHARPAVARDRHGNQDLPEREEINQTYSREDISAIAVNDISGSVTVENSDGANIEVHVVRSARSQDDLTHRKILLDRVGNKLQVHTEPHHGFDWDNVDVRQRVLLRVPTNIDLTINDISGSVTIARVDGHMRINDISGSVDVASTAGSPHINDISGSVTVTITNLDAEGIRINDISGPVDLRVSGVASADIRIDDISGSISVDLPTAVVVGKIDSESYHGRIGNGGPVIGINDISGSVEIHSN